MHYKCPKCQSLSLKVVRLRKMLRVELDRQLKILGATCNRRPVVSQEAPKYEVAFSQE